MSSRYLPSIMRRTLETRVKEARVVAEDGALDAIRRLGVAEAKAPTYLTDAEKELRRRLRAHARALGDVFDKTEEVQETKRLVESAAYAHWHRMLFSRFLAERGLLRNPEHDVPVSLNDCRELAEAEGLTDPWAIAERYAASMLPAVFRIDDPVLALRLDPVHIQKLQRLVTGLDSQVFQAEDSLGWTYQFWRAAEKQAVNDSGVKIGADEIPAVTQLFTEPYMVRFLLHNTLGAWWAGKLLAADPALAQSAADEDVLRAACSLPNYSFEMLRFVREEESGAWRPAAGTFATWPSEAKAITMLDPCCGSGHFLTEALAILTALRQAEEHLSPAEAVAAVLRDNLHGLEIDGRCVQIAAFAVALTAWRIGGWQTLPLLQIAWIGAPPPLPKREFVALADGDLELEYAFAGLHDLFTQAPVLGTLLEPSGGDLFEAEKFKEVERLLERLLTKTRRAEPESVEGVIAARGMADAASLLFRQYTFQATNVPFLTASSFNPALEAHIQKFAPSAAADLATAMMYRAFKLGTSLACVSINQWLFQVKHIPFRKFLKANCSILTLADLGESAFESNQAQGAFVALSIIEKSATAQTCTTINARSPKTTSGKESSLLTQPIKLFDHDQIYVGSDEIIALDGISNAPPISLRAGSYQGTSTGDNLRYLRKFWEIEPAKGWTLFQMPPEQMGMISGCSTYIKWSDIEKNKDNAAIRGEKAWSRQGIIFGKMRDLPFAPFFGGKFSNSAPVLVPHREVDFGSILAFVESGEFTVELRKLNPAVAVENGYLNKVPFDERRWLNLSDPKKFFHAYTDNPTQDVFSGHPRTAAIGIAIHVALARVCGFKWPAEYLEKAYHAEETREWAANARQLPFCDSDGLCCIPAVAGEKPLVARLRGFLAATYDTTWSDAFERKLVAEADEFLDKKVARDGSLDTWLRERAFRQHCALFGQYPFLWHISDGLKDGFSVFVHYHRFDQANLRKLTYTLLGNWLQRAKDENNALRYEKGRELQQMLEKILEGEKPYDIFIRWKSLAEQPLGWDPDLDDGVRQNIRPFIKAGVLTHDLSKVLTEKDRGNDVASAPWFPVFKGERRNNHHTTLAEKLAAREAIGRPKEGAE